MNEAGISQIKLAQLDEVLDVSAFSKFKTVVFHWCNDGYTWTAILKGAPTYKGEPVETRPHQANGKRKGFKTMAGAKRNFIQQEKRT